MLMKTLLFFTFMFSVSAQAAGIDFCKTPDQYKKLVDMFSLKPNEKHSYDGSSGLLQCQEMTTKKLRTWYKGGSRSKDPAYQWENHIVFYGCKEKCEALSKAADDKTKEADLKSCYDKALEESKGDALKCESVAYILQKAKVDWEKPKHVKKEDREFKQLGIKCSNSGLETLDYEACVEFAEGFENAEAIQNIAYQGQSLVYQDKMMDAQTKVAQEKDAAKGALKATGESLNLQKDMYNQRGAVDGAKLAWLYSKYSEIPDEETIQSHCKGFQAFGQEAILGKVSANDCYQSSMGPGGNFDILKNQQARDKMKAKMIQVATSMGSNLILANLLGKRAKDVDNALAKIDEFKPIDPFTVSEEEAQTTYCKQNPGDPKCLGEGLDRITDGISDNIITFGEGAAGTVYGNPNKGETNAIASGGGSGSKDTKIDPVGSIIPAAQKNNSMEDSTAATVKAGGTGGGGGGGGGSAGGGGGGGGGPLPQGPSDAVAAIEKGKAPSYGGGDGSLSMMGGFGINKPKGDKGKDEGNPFGKLFDKDGAKASNNINFRDLASVGKKGDNLFDMISKRYSSVKADNRLLEYELAK